VALPSVAATPAPPTATPAPPTATPVPPTATPAPPTATPVPGGTAFTDRAGAGYVAIPVGAGVAAFRIGRTEVTNAQYAQCVAAGACTVPVVPEDVAASLRENGYPEKYWVSRYGDAAYAEHPVVWVTREQARAYAAWAGGRLPTDTEWMRACEGDDGRTYPWGEAAPDGRLANFYDPAQDSDTSDDDVGDTTAVGSYPAGASPYGALDMAGNVWEWVEADDGDDGRYILRGGAFYDDADSVVCGARAEVDFVVDDNDVGFRVVSPGP
jgi:formylglycine-generating enzyme required for sulfatase activity